MYKIHPGCHYCFANFTPDDDQDTFDALVCCQCGSTYHLNCWQRIESCTKCASSQSKQTTISISSSLPYIEKRHPIPIEPTAIRYLIGSWGVTPLQARIAALLGAMILLITLVLIGRSIYIARTSVINTVADSSSAIDIPSSHQATPIPLFNALQPLYATIGQPSPVPTVIIRGPSYVQIQDVHLRVKPGRDQESLDILPRGVKVQVIGESQMVEESIWVKVQIEQRIGWVNQRYLIPIINESAEFPRARVIGVAPDQLRVRSEPSLTAMIIDRLSERAECVLLDARKVNGIQWQHIKIDQTSGWVKSIYVDPIQ